MAPRHLLPLAASVKQSTWETPRRAAGRAPRSGNGAPNATRSPPVQSRRQGVSVLLTFSGRNGPQKAGSGDAVWSMVGDGEGSLPVKLWLQGRLRW
jgi:hypothetical protein